MKGRSPKVCFIIQKQDIESILSFTKVKTIFDWKLWNCRCSWGFKKNYTGALCTIIYRLISFCISPLAKVIEACAHDYCHTHTHKFCRVWCTNACFLHAGLNPVYFCSCKEVLPIWSWSDTWQYNHFHKTKIRCTQFSMSAS